MEYFISKKAKSISLSQTIAMDIKFKKMKKEGLKVISFGAGEPDFGTLNNIKKAAIYAINNEITKYTEVSGMLPLKEAICKKFLENNLIYNTSNIVVSSGAKHSLMNVFIAICDNTDEVIIPAPYWVSYPEMIKISGGVPVIVQTNKSNNFKITSEQFEKNITSKTKAIILNTPCNPTGSVYNKDELKKIAEIAVDKNILVISDEVYEKFTYNCKHESIASLNNKIKKLTVVINGVSKTYAMTGWRIGYSASTYEIAKNISNIQSHMTSNPNSIAQYASIEALSGNQDAIIDMSNEYKKRMEYMVEKINSIKDLSCIKPHGAFYVFVNIKKLLGKNYYGKNINTSYELCENILEKALVSIIPGNGFGAPDYARFSFATDMQSIIQGLNRIEEYINGRL
ncbi:MAG: pyridoxal phosphate-dependent aminotransferase [Clostridiales bacterium]|jgi:aspartate aminotransferase|nr:pyridoxal phosphate-dependent aminotransferase [Clostridiales bacterium]